MASNRHLLQGVGVGAAPGKAGDVGDPQTKLAGFLRNQRLAHESPSADLPEYVGPTGIPGQEHHWSGHRVGCGGEESASKFGQAGRDWQNLEASGGRRSAWRDLLCDSFFRPYDVFDDPRPRHLAKCLRSFSQRCQGLSHCRLVL